MHGEGEAQDRDRADVRGGAAGDPGAGGAPADDERKTDERVPAQLLDDRRPGRIELSRRGGATPARDPVGLLDECHADPGRERSVRRRNEVRRLNTAARAVPEHERSHRPVDRMEVGPREPVRRVELEDPASLAARGSALTYLLPSTTGRGGGMSTEENKALIRRYIDAIDGNDSSDWSILDEFIAEDVVVHNPQLPGLTPDRDGIKQAAEMFRQATPGRHEIPLQVAEGDLVVSLIVGRGVHAGELLEIPATGNNVETEGIGIHRIANGKIAEYWGVTDTVRVLQQVGALPEPPA
jgi:predicted ester cyclase